MRAIVTLALTLSICAVCGCADRAAAPSSPAPAPQQTFAPTKKSAPAGIHNLVHASPRIFTGSDPEGEAGFASLAQLGIKTIASVDGARPNVEAARRHGMRYVHIPIGYDAIPPQAGEALARLVRDTAGPIYVHCHHGQHRGPAAAAVACIAAGETTAQQGRVILELAGTGKNYPGLWRDVAAYRPPAKNAALPELHEVAEVESYAAAMAKIDRNFDNLKFCQEADWSVPAEHPDLAPRQEALILKEGLREALRNLVADQPAELRAWLGEAASTAAAIEQALQRNEGAAATELLKALEQSCKKCHNKYRNG